MGKNEACRLMADIVELGDGIDRVAEELGNGSLASWTLGHVADALLWAALYEI
jgi:hypothetical protein